MTRASYKRVSAKIQHKMGDTSCNCPACGSSRVIPAGPQPNIPSNLYADIIVLTLLAEIQKRFLPEDGPDITTRSWGADEDKQDTDDDVQVQRVSQTRAGAGAGDKGRIDDYLRNVDAETTR